MRQRQAGRREYSITVIRQIPQVLNYYLSGNALCAVRIHIGSFNCSGIFEFNAAIQ